MIMLETIKINKIDEKIAEIWLNRPQVLNAVNVQLAHDFVQALEMVISDTNLRVVLIRGEGTSFCAGADLKEMSVGIPRNIHFEKVQNLQSITKKMVSSNKIFISVVHGYAIGIGVEIILATDLVICDENSIFRFPEVEIDATVTGGGHKLLLSRVGMLKAKELIFLGIPLSGKQAEKVGLVNKAVLKDVFNEVVLDIAKQLKEKPVQGISAAKESLQFAENSTLASVIDHEVISALTSAEKGQRTSIVKEKMEKA
jgi:enoyl-CoA hydratase/carnithine racemase